MKRVWSTVCIAAVILLCIIAPLSQATLAADAQETAWDAYDYYHYYAVTYKDRTAGSNGERAAANWLAGQLRDMGYVANPVPFTISQTRTDANGDTVQVELTSYNVIATKTANLTDNRPALLLAANYGNEYQLNSALSDALQWEDACRNGTAVGTLLAIAQDLSRAQVGFDVVICFWGADCGGYAISSQYVNRGAAEFIAANGSTLDKLLGYIQLDAVGCGDNLNVYYDEVKRTHARYSDALIKRNRWNVGTKPFDPGYMYSVQGSLQYSHPGLNGANALFMEAGVPSMYLFGYNWVGGTKNSESATKPDILYTTNDNVDNYESLYGKDAIQSRLEMTRQLVVSLVTSADFEAEWTAARDDADYWGMNSNDVVIGLSLAVAAVTVIVCVVMCVLYAKKAKAAGKPDFSVGSSFINGQADTSEDIFDGTTPVQGEQGAVDDGRADTPSTKADDDDIFGEY